MTWMQIYMNYKTNGSAQNCPECGHALNVETTPYSITFSCDSCKAFRHFDEIKTDKPAQQ